MERHWPHSAVMWAFVMGFMLIQGSEGMRDIDGTARSAMGALQRDMKMLGDITICTGLKRYIACIEGSNLAITKAFWGRISDKVCPSDDGDPVTDCDGSEDTLPLVKGYCEGKRECKLEARHTLLQKNGTHHCPGVNKYLVVNYTCIPESKSVALCDSAETTLTCEAGWVIDIADIFWGRRSHAKYCGAEEGMECDSSDSAAKYIRSNCDGHRRCLVRADPTLLDNAHSPCTTILKYLMINYVCKPPEKESSSLMEVMEVPSADHPEGGKKKEKEDKKKDVDEQEEKESVMINHIADDRAYFPLEIPEPDTSSHSKEKKKSFFTAMKKEEADELSKALLGGVGLSVDLTERPKTTEGFRRSPKNNNSGKKNNKEEIGSKRDKEEFPFLFAAKERAEEKRKERKAAVLRKTKAELTDEGFYDEEFAKIAAKSKKRKSGVESLTPSEPSAVRTILARAKEVLQSLASDNSKFQAVVEKRGRIAHNRSSTMEETNNPDIVKKSGMPQQVVTEATVVGLHVPEPALVRDIAKETAGVFEMKSGTPPSAKTPPEIPMFGNVP